MAPVFDVDWITFDCYGTLIDWELGLRHYLSRLLIAKRVSVPADEVMKAWEAIQFKMIQQPYRRYREILGRSLDEALRTVKVTYQPEDGQKLVMAMGAWRPFKDVAPALGRLKKGYKLAILSNTDKDIISRTLTYLGVDFDVVLTAEDVRAYKPSPKGFKELLKRMDCAPDRVMHTAFGVKYDLGPAAELGMKTCIVKRGVLPKRMSVSPDLMAADLSAVADAMAK